MRVFTNPGSNLPRAAVDRYGIVLTPQQIVAGGVSYDTRETIPLARVDEWTRASGEYPYVVGTTAPELTALLLEHLARDPEALVITTSRKIIRTYDAALAAVDVIKARPKLAGARIRVIDSGVTDVGAGLMVLAAAEAARANMPLPDVCALVDGMRLRMQTIAYLHTLENAVRGGRVGFLRAWLANALELRPMLRFRDGELVEAGRVRMRDDRIDLLARAVTMGLEGKKVWAAVAHGDAPLEGDALMRAIAQRCEVAFWYAPPLSSSIYLHIGRGALAAGVVPMPDDAPVPPAAVR